MSPHIPTILLYNEKVHPGRENLTQVIPPPRYCIADFSRLVKGTEPYIPIFLITCRANPSLSQFIIQIEQALLFYLLFMSLLRCGIGLRGQLIFSTKAADRFFLLPLIEGKTASSAFDRQFDLLVC